VASPLKRYIQQEVEDQIAEKILLGALEKEGEIIIDVENNKLSDSYYDFLASEARQASFVAVAKKDIKYIANNIFSSMQNGEKIDLENIGVTVYTNIQKEIEAVAKKIASKIKEGYRYSDFALYTTKPEEYDKIISRVFYENNLKYYLPKSKSICESILVKYIQGILNLAPKGLNLDKALQI